MFVRMRGFQALGRRFESPLDSISVGLVAIYKCTALWRAYQLLVFLQLKDPLELFVKRRDNSRFPVLRVEISEAKTNPFFLSSFWLSRLYLYRTSISRFGLLTCMRYIARFRNNHAQ